jgi:Anti-sigma factor NepR
MNKRKSSQSKSPMEAEQYTASAAPKLDPEIKAKIGQQLRTLYSDVVSQGVPDRFAAILRQLDEREAVAADPDEQNSGAKKHDAGAHDVKDSGTASDSASSNDGSQNEPS